MKVVTNVAVGRNLHGINLDLSNHAGSLAWPSGVFKNKHSNVHCERFCPGSTGFTRVINVKVGASMFLLMMTILFV